MAVLQTAGRATEDSGFDDTWVESDVYGPLLHNKSWNTSIWNDL